jgi:phosphoribosylformylglycinamidine (FGAM) synthase PurS component
MHGTYLIEVGYKEGVKDPLAQGLSHEIHQWGLTTLKRAATSQLYRFVGDLTPADRERAARDLLCDPVIQEAHDGALSASPPAPLPRGEGGRRPGEAITIDVWYKSGVTDVIGESVLKGLRDLNLSGIAEVRTGMRYRLWGVRDAVAANKLALALLVNPLVHDHFISTTTSLADRHAN